jgi:hypothetical protein
MKRFDITKGGYAEIDMESVKFCGRDGDVLFTVSGDELQSIAGEQSSLARNLKPFDKWQIGQATGMLQQYQHLQLIGVHRLPDDTFALEVEYKGESCFACNWGQFWDLAMARS